MISAKARRKFWSKARGGIFKCPECGGVVTITPREKGECHDCSKCSWCNVIDFEEEREEIMNGR